MSSEAKKQRGHIQIEYEGKPEADTIPSEKVFPFREVGVLPQEGDNVAISTRKLEAGTKVQLKDKILVLSHTVLEGHRFCVERIETAKSLLSWGLPFGFALRDIEIGEYVCNASLLEALRMRNLNFPLPSEPNFESRILPATIDEQNFKPGVQVSKYTEHRTFQGYLREGKRGVGTRNYIVVLGLISTVGGFTRILESQLKKSVDLSKYPNIDGIVAISHTEGATIDIPINNLNFLLRTLSGFIVHPNVGAVLIVDGGLDEQQGKKIPSLNKRSIAKFLEEKGYPLGDVIHEFYSLTGNLSSDATAGVSIVQSWLEKVNNFKRSAQPLDALSVALQCGGSDAFSGVSGNPLAGWVAKEIIKNGGSAVLAETDELIGAEAYILRNCASLDVAKQFLNTVNKFKEWAGWHGHTAEGNPSGGNKFRGLYNIALKSLGAAMKKPHDVTLDHVIDYSERLSDYPPNGYYFMNSPGNDIESIAGQVATGCQIIFFITGNGSITNFPFVPTIKIVTTTGRFNMLAKDMDVNAGRYLDGTPLEEVGKDMFELTVKVANGLKSAGERAGHSQVSIWRNWQMTSSIGLKELQTVPDTFSGISIVTKKESDPRHNIKFNLFKNEEGKYVTNNIGLILPTSLCSGQIARLIADKLNTRALPGISKFVALPHTEGCGASDGSAEAIYKRTVFGHLVSPVVRYGLLLEHGCEKAHNDYMAQILVSLGLPLSKFGWASVQLDGGIDKVSHKVQDWFEEKLKNSSELLRESVGLEHLKIALITPPSSKVSSEVGKCLAHLAQGIVCSGGLVIVPKNASLLKNNVFLGEVIDETSGISSITPTLGYSQRPQARGFHIMDTPSDHWVETLTGLVACGVEVVLSLVEEHVFSKILPSHPMVPVIQVTTANALKDVSKDAFDLVLPEDTTSWEKSLFDIVAKTLSQEYLPKQTQNCDFQIARGVLGISM